MRISVTVVACDVDISNDFMAFEVFPDMSLEAIKGFVQDEINVAPQKQHFLHNGQPVADTSQTLTSLGINEGEVLSLVIRSGPLQSSRGQSQRGGSSRSQPQQASPDAETIRLQLLNNPETLQNIQANDPELISVIHNAAKFKDLFDARIQRQTEAQAEKEEMMGLLDSDPFNPEAQAKIEELIRQEAVMENMKRALEDNPESFGRVVMLYIDVVVNETPIKAFVDSGAQTTIMSPEAAERCGILRLIDRRFGGIARGVGTAKILGRVHSADLQVGPYSLASSFTVMEGKGVDLLLGLDMLKRHQMCIDLKDNVLRIQDSAIPFLSENEAPKEFEAALDDEATVKGPGNTEIGASTGTVKPEGTSSSSQPQPQQQQMPASKAPAPAPQKQKQKEQSQPQTLAQSSSRLPPNVTEAAIAQIIDVGFSRAEAITALEQAQGNVEIAIGLLL